MLSRSVLRSTRGVRVRSTNIVRQTRHQSTNSNAGKNSDNGLSPVLAGGLAGGAVAVVGVYTWYHLSGIRTVVKSTQQVKSYFDSATAKVKDAVPDDSSQLLGWLRQTATSYTAFVPGARGFIDTTFNDIEAVRAEHKDEVDKLVREAYHELREASKSGLSLETAQRVGEIGQKYAARVADLAGDAAEQILDNHPQLKDKVGAPLQQLKQMGEAYGPEAKKQVDEIWGQIKEITSSGVSMDTVNKVRQLVQDKSEALRKMGDEAWKKGMEQAGPYLDRNPKIKQLVTENADALKQGNAMELVQKLKQAVESGDLGDLQSYVSRAVDKAKQYGGGGGGGGGLEQYLQMIPGGDKIAPKLSQLQEIAQKHGQEAEKLMKETMEEVGQVLERKAAEAQKLADKARKDAK